MRFCEERLATGARSRTRFCVAFTTDLIFVHVKLHKRTIFRETEFHPSANWRKDEENYNLSSHPLLNIIFENPTRPDAV